MEHTQPGGGTAGQGGTAGGAGGTPSRMSDATETGPQGAGAALDQARQTVEQLKDHIQGQAAPVVEQAQQTAGQVVDQAREQVASRATSQKDRVADALAMVAQAVRQTGQELRGQDQPMVANYVDRGAQTVERAANYLRARDAGELLDDTQQFARRNPALFLGGSFALGLLAARFLRSSAPPQSATAGYLPAPSPSAMYPAARQTYGQGSPAASPTYTPPPSGEGLSATAPPTAGVELSEMDRPEAGRPAPAGSQPHVPVRSTAARPDDGTGSAGGSRRRAES